MYQYPSLNYIEDGPHSLLEPPCPAYSNVTVRRAFIVWMYCGQKNKFKDVCNYYHYLEAVEDKLPLEQRVASRHHEFNMFCNAPPTSPFLQNLFPKLYSDSPIQPDYVKKLEAIKNDKCIFKLEGFNQIRQKGVNTAEIIETSKIIRKYCLSKSLPLRKFLENFREYANKCDLKDTVTNVATYIKRKMIQSELETAANYPEDFSFLDSTIDSEEEQEDVIEDNNNIEPEIIKPIETDKLKSTIKITNGSDSNGLKDKDERKYNSCAEFIKSFSQCQSVTQTQNIPRAKTNKSNNISLETYSPLTPKIDDFVELFGQNRQKSKSVESLIQGKPNIIVDGFGFSNQNLFDSSHTKVSELNKLRKI